MTVTASPRRAGPFPGTGVIVAYPFDFKVFAKADLLVVATDDDTGVDTTLTLDSDYSVTLNVDQNNDPGGTIAYLVSGVPTALPVGTSLTAVGNLEYSQPTDITNQGGFYPQAIENALDRNTMLMQQIGEIAERALVLPIGDDTDVTLPGPAERANKVQAYGPSGEPIVIVGVDSSSAAFLQTMLADTTSAANGAGLVGYNINRTYADATAGGKLGCVAWLHDFSVVGDNLTDDSAAWQVAIDYVAAQGGGWLFAKRGKAYRLITPPIVKAGVKIDLQGCTVNLKFASGVDSVGFDVRDYAGIQNGTINAVQDGNPAGSNPVHHCAVFVGAADASLAGRTGWFLRNLTITNNRSDSVGGSGITVFDESNNGHIEDIYFPSSSTLAVGVRIHWAGDGGSPNPAVSHHPYNITVRNIRAGSMTKAANVDTALVDIVSGYCISVDNVHCDRWDGDSVVQVRPGAFGSAVASADVQNVFMHGITIRNVTCMRALNHCVLINGRAHGAGAIPAANYPIPCIVENVKTNGAAASATNGTAGVRVTYTSGVIVRNADVAFHDRGIYCDEASSDCRFYYCKTHHNNESGCMVVHATTNPTDILFEGCDSYLNGQDGGSHAGYYTEACQRVTFRDCTAGASSSETTQLRGFWIAATSGNTQFSGRNRVRNVKGGGTFYLFQDAVYGDIKYGGGSNAALSTGATQWAPLQGVGLNTTENDVSILSPNATLVLTNFRAQVTTAPTGATKLRNFRVVDDGGATALEVNIVDTATNATDTDAVIVAANSYLSVQCQVANTPAAAYGKWSCEGFLG